MDQCSRYAPAGRAWLFVADLLVLVACLLLVLSLRRPLGIAPGLSHESAVAHVLFAVTFGVLVLVRLAQDHQYERRRRFARIEDMSTVVRAAVCAAALALLLGVATDGFLLGAEPYSRIVLGLVLVAPIAGLIAVRLVADARQRASFRSGRHLSRLLVVGDGERAARFAEQVAAAPERGYVCIASEVVPDRSIASCMAAFVTELDEHQPDEVILALELAHPHLREALAREVAYRALSLRVLDDVFESWYELPVCEYEGIPVSTLLQAPLDRAAHRLKTSADVALAVVGVVLLAPFFVLVSLLIWCEDRGPVLFVQERVGERGKRFMVLKFRTMRVDAEAHMALLLDQNEVDGPIFKMRHDPRVTRVGRWLRRFSIDELPQLFNVVCGQMSLVGPRPPLPSEVTEYRVDQRRRLIVRPGMTGLWQVSGRSDTTFDEMVALDLAYIQRWSPWLDLRIMLRTARAVLGSRGAY